MRLSVLIPAYNEEGSLAATVASCSYQLRRHQIPHEILIINDQSEDSTLVICQELASLYHEVRYLTNDLPSHGIGVAVRYGLSHLDGDCVALVMADGSEDPLDLVEAYRELQQGVDCVFGSRFITGSLVVHYPKNKWILNRLVNRLIQLLFQISYNDTTNAFKLYRRSVIEGIQPLLSNHFELLVEMPLKTMMKGYSYTVIPLRWYNRKTGVSKLRIREMSGPYLRRLLSLWILHQQTKKNNRHLFR